MTLYNLDHVAEQDYVALGTTLGFILGLHEQKCKEGRRCQEARRQIAAFVAHCLGVDDSADFDEMKAMIHAHKKNCRCPRVGQGE